MQDFKKLAVWQKGHELSLATYKLTASFPKSEQFGLTIQVRRCVSCITANIAEGCGRGSDADFSRFIQIAIGSTCELECHLILACDLKFLKLNEYDKIYVSLNEVRKMLIALNQRLKTSSSKLKA
jgi:four helix bundle protein